MEDPEQLEKVYVDLPNHWAVGGESFWSRRLTGQNFELRNTPFYAYGLNFLDVVEAIPDGPGLKPRVRRLVQPSGHRTLRVYFDDSVPDEERMPLLLSLKPLGASIENANGRLFALDIESTRECSAVCDRLFAWEQEGRLSYETCEARVPGSFDDIPEEADSSGSKEAG